MASARLAPSWMRAATSDQIRPIRVRDDCSATMFSAPSRVIPLRSMTASCRRLSSTSTDRGGSQLWGASPRSEITPDRAAAAARTSSTSQPRSRSRLTTVPAESAASVPCWVRPPVSRALKTKLGICEPYHTVTADKTSCTVVSPLVIFASASSTRRGTFRGGRRRTMLALVGARGDRAARGLRRRAASRTVPTGRRTRGRRSTGNRPDRRPSCRPPADCPGRRPRLSVSGRGWRQRAQSRRTSRWATASRIVAAIR